MIHYNVRHLSDTDTIPIWKAEIREKERVKEVLAEIRQEIEQAKCPAEPHNVDYNSAYNDGLDGALRIIDKHMKGGDIHDN